VVLALPFVKGVSALQQTILQGTLPTKQSIPLIHANQAASLGYDGRGTYAAVLDTGVDWRDPWFGSCTAPGQPSTCKVAVAEDVASDDHKLDDDGHGTNVSGIVVAVAPAAKLVTLDVFRGDGSSTADQIKALNMLIDLNRKGMNIRSVNMSLGAHLSYFSSTCKSDPGGGPNQLAGIFGELRGLGIMPVLAAGNDGGLGATGVAYPACTDGAVRVGAVYDANVGAQFWSGCIELHPRRDGVTCFSQRAPNLSLFAPVDQIERALSGSGPVIRDRRSGTKHRLDVVRRSIRWA